MAEIIFFEFFDLAEFFSSQAKFPLCLHGETDGDGRAGAEVPVDDRALVAESPLPPAVHRWAPRGGRETAPRGPFIATRRGRNQHGQEHRPPLGAGLRYQRFHAHHFHSCPTSTHPCCSENVWSRLKDRVTKQLSSRRTSLTKATMIAVAQRQWLALVRDPNVVRPLFLSMPARLREVERLKGAFTKY